MIDNSVEVLLWILLIAVFCTLIATLLVAKAPLRDNKGNELYDNGSRKYDNAGNTLTPDGRLMFDEQERENWRS